MKIRFKEAENYFGIKFNYYIFWKLSFSKQLQIVFIKIMKKKKVFQKNYKIIIINLDKERFYVFVDFDDETNIVDEGYDFEFHSLFSIIFKKSEIENLTCFPFVNCETQSYIYLFINLFFESIYLHKTNKRFDDLYFLIPNIDFF